MTTEKPNPAPSREQADRSRKHVNVDCPPDKKSGLDDFKSKVDLPGKTDSGPEPDLSRQSAVGSR